ncbi:MAG: hypothetical protein V7603_1489 [Micromonosporaceae bacterium]
MEPVACHRVEFTDCRSGEYGLTWAQQSLARWIRTAGPGPAVLSVPRAGRLPDGCTVAGVVRAVCAVAARHDSLRATFFRAADGAWRQRIHAQGRLDIPVYEAGDNDPVVVKDAVDIELRLRPYAAGDLPLRAAVITQRGVPCMLAVTVRHLAADAVAAGLVFEEISRLAAERTAPLLPAWQPEDMLRHEASDAGRRQARRAADHWAATLRHAPNAVFPIRAARGRRRAALEVAIESAALAAGVFVLGRRYRAGETDVLLAAFGLLVGAVSGHRTCAFNLASANRLRPELAAAVGNFYQFSPIALRADGSLRDVVRRARAQSLAAYRFGHYDPTLAEQTRVDIQRERGTFADLSCAVNFGVGIGSPYRRGPEESRLGIAVYQDATAALIRRLVASSTTEVLAHVHGAPAGLLLSVWWLADRAVLTLAGDSALFGVGELRELLVCLERIVVSAACADGDVEAGELAAGAGAAPLPVADGLCYVDGCWVDLAAVRDLVTSATGCRSGRVRLAGGPDGSRIEAWLPATPGLTPESAHTACVAALPSGQFTMTPHRYLVGAGPLRPDGDSDEAWAAVPVALAGSGRCRSGSGRDGTGAARVTHDSATRQR